MWSRLALCLLVSIVYTTSGEDSSTNPAWNKNFQYVYEVRSRSLVSLDQLSNEYSGFFLKALIEIRPRPDGNLDAKIVQPQYVPIQGKLKEKWNQDIPDSELPYKPLQLSSEPFQIQLEQNVVRNIIVNNNINNWEANVIKSFVSQFQLDTNAQNVIPSDNSDSAVYKTMEETVTGMTETFYQIDQILEPALLPEAWSINDRYNRPSNKIFQVIKMKNFTNSPIVPSYHFGLDGLQHYEPSNNVGNFLSRTAISNAIITGDLQNYTIHNSVSIEEIYVSPALTGNQKGSVYNLVNVTLQQMTPKNQQNSNVVNPVQIGLIYGYDKPFDKVNSPRPVKPRAQASGLNAGISWNENSSQENQIVKRSIGSKQLLNSLESLRNPENPDYLQPQPDLQNPPEAPLLPYFVGYKGQSIKKQQNIIDTVRQVAQKIAQEFENPSQILEENTVSKFVMLSSLVRVMSAQEIQQLGSQLYTQEKKGIKASTWLAFYSSVAQSGTAPAVANLLEWIKNGKIVEVEAAEAVTTAIDSIRTPTFDLIKLIYQNVKDQKLMQQQSLNESLVLSFSTLVHEVYLNQEVSHNKYPVYSFGSFRVAEGRDFVVKEVIPWFSQQLTAAFNRNDTQKIHVYIRALGNVGEQHILEAFQPYLENEKPASVIQRVHMVIALDYMSRIHPVEVRSVTFRIAENLIENEEVRVAAVYQLMRTNPSPAMLQRIALNTQIDQAEYVNAAIKSVIETASELQGQQNAALREAALSARPLLNNRQYGLRYSQEYLRSFVSKMYEQESYKQTTVLFAGKDSAIPKGVLYSLTAHLSGVRQRYISLQWIVSSVEDLFTAFEQRTQKYQEQVKQKQQANPEQHPWTSEYTAKILKMQNQPREQLEGYLSLKISAMQKLLSLNNQTIDELVQIVQQMQANLKEGQVFQYRSMKILKEAAMSVPTILGLPFMYTFDVPVLLKAQAAIQASANSEIVQGGLLQRPDRINSELDINALVSARIQSRITIFTPFDSQRYTAGFNKNLQIEIPLKGRIELNLQNKQVRVSIENPGQKQNTQLVHYSNVPYTAKNPIFVLKPERRIIKSDQINRIFYNLGRDSTGIAVNIEVNSEQIINLAYIIEKLSKYDLMTDILGSWISSNMEYTSIDVGISSSKSSTEKIVFEMGYETAYKSQKNGSLPASIQNQPSQIPQFESDPLKRRSQFINKVSEGINNVKSVVVDANVQFLGQRKLGYQITVAGSKSNVDPNGRFIAWVEQTNQTQQVIRAYVDGIASFPNTNGLDLNFAMKMNPESQVDLLALVERNQQVSRFEAKLQLNKTKERVQYLENRPEYKKYQKHPNLPLTIVARMIAQANFLNQINMSAKYENLDPEISNSFYKAYSIFRHYFYPRINEDIFINRNEKTVNVQVKFSPDLRFANTSIESDYVKVELYDLALFNWAQKLIVPHPVFHLRSRMFSYFYNFDTFRPICAFNSLIANTFDNRTYFPVLEKNAWTVVSQYVPRRPSSAELQIPVPPHLQYEQFAVEQLRQLDDSYVVYARPNAQNQKQKDMKIVFITPETKGKIVEVLIQATGAGLPKVLVNNQEVQVSEQQSTDFYGDLLQIYALPNRELKVELKNVFYIVSNGETMKVTTVSSKLLDASRGICGTFTGEMHDDFLTPKNDVTQDEDEFIRSYTISAENLNPRRPSSSEESERQPLPQFRKKKNLHPNYITEQDIGGDSRNNNKNSCVKLQTRFIERGDQICFTLRPLPACKPSCKSKGIITRQVPITCLDRSPLSIMWKNEILKGASPDFSLKPRSGSIPISFPKQCLP